MTSKLEDFTSWCKKVGINFEGLEIRSAGEGAGNGVYASRFFRMEQNCITLPDSVLITAGKVADIDKYSDLLETSKILLKPFEILTLFFCLEKAPESEWTPYLSMLPPDFDTPAYRQIEIDPEDLPVSIRDYYIGQLKDLKEIYSNLIEIVPDLEYQIFLWAWHVVNTRCIYVENKPHPKVDNSEGDTLAVIPFVDMLNHDPEAQCVAVHQKSTKSYVVRTNSCIREGSQVYVCYGPHNNPRLWMEYGFTMENNPNVKVIIKPELFLALAQKCGVKITPAHRDAINEAGLPSSLYKSDEGPSWALRTNVRLLLMGQKEITRWRDIIYQEKEKGFDSDEDADVLEKEENRLIQNIMGELRVIMIQKRNKVDQRLQWMWDEQIEIIDVVIAAAQ